MSLRIQKYSSSCQPFSAAFVSVASEWPSEFLCCSQFGVEQSCLVGTCFPVQSQGSPSSPPSQFCFLLIPATDCSGHVRLPFVPICLQMLRLSRHEWRREVREGFECRLRQIAAVRSLFVLFLAFLSGSRLSSDVAPLEPWWLVWVGIAVINSLLVH